MNFLVTNWKKDPKVIYQDFEFKITLRFLIPKWRKLKLIYRKEILQSLEENVVL